MNDIKNQERYRKTNVVPYDSKWPLMYDEERVKIQKILNNELTSIYHIGSTAVPELRAKPVIDILVVVKNINAFEKLRSAFELMGYHWMGEYGIPGRRYLWRIASQNIDYHIQCFEEQNENINKCLAFRDYLRTFPKKAQEYSSAKELANKIYPDDARAYWEEKSEFLETLLNEALEWQKKSN